MTLHQQWDSGTLFSDGAARTCFGSKRAVKHPPPPRSTASGFLGDFDFIGFLQLFTQSLLAVGQAPQQCVLPLLWQGPEQSHTRRQSPHCRFYFELVRALPFATASTTSVYSSPGFLHFAR
jgi:hypothetical protein